MFYGGIGKNVYIKILGFSVICSRKSLLACNGYGREKEEDNSIQNVLQRIIFCGSGRPYYLLTSAGYMKNANLMRALFSGYSLT